jgi:RNA polymerase sigma factor (sigma-70 family)
MSANEPQNTEEQALWNAFAQGDDNSLEILYRRYFDELYAYGNKWLNNAALTEDSIQDLFVKLMRNRANLSTPVSVKYYLFRSFRTVVVDRLKAKNRFAFVDEPGDHHFFFELSPERQIIDQENAALLQQKLTAALQTLTPRQREAIFLRYIEGFSYKEVAEMMELTAKGTYKLMARAIEALKEQMIGFLILLFLKTLFFSFC